MTSIFGSGLHWPYKTDPSGRLATSAGPDRMLDTVEQVLDTPKGVCPLDPAYGHGVDIYDTVGSADVLGWQGLLRST